MRAHCARSETRVGSRKYRPSTKASLWLACVNIQPWKRHQSLRRLQCVEGGGREHAHAPSQPRATLGNPSTPPFACSATTATEKYASVGGVACGVARPRPPTPHAAETVNSIPTKLTGGLATSAGVLTASSSAGDGEEKAAFPGRLMCTPAARPQTAPPPATSRADVGRHGLVDARRAGDERGHVGGEQQRGRRREQGGVSRAVDVKPRGEATDAAAARNQLHIRWATWPR